MEFLGQGSDSSHSCNLRHSCGNAGSLNALCWARESNLCPGAAEMPPMPLHHSELQSKVFFKTDTMEFGGIHDPQRASESIQKHSEKEPNLQVALTFPEVNLHLKTTSSTGSPQVRSCAGLAYTHWLAPPSRPLDGQLWW